MAGIPDSTPEARPARHKERLDLPRFFTVSLIWADSAYTAVVDWVRRLRKRRKLRLEIVRRAEDAVGFEVQPHRWIVERTLA